MTGAAKIKALYRRSAISVMNGECKMRKKMKRSLAFFLVLVMVMSVVGGSLYSIATETATSSDLIPSSSGELDKETLPDPEKVPSVEEYQKEDDLKIEESAVTTTEKVQEETDKALPLEYVASIADGTRICAYAATDVLPEGAVLKVSELSENSDAFTEAKAAVEAKGIAFDGMMAMDIHFEVDGQEVEPNGFVKVQLELAAGTIPDEVDPDTIAVQHLEETGSGVKVETVADASSATDGSVMVKSETVKANFTVNSFSSFTITWKGNRQNNYFEITAHYVDTSGTEIDTAVSNQSISNGTTITFADNVNYGGRTIEGYTYQKATYASYDGEQITKMTAGRTGNNYTITFYGGNSVVQTLTWQNGSTQTADIYLVYQRDKLSIRDTIKEDGLLTAVPDSSIDATDKEVTYRWYKSADGKTWDNPVVREKVTGDSYNISEDGSKLNVALDDGAQMYYKVELLLNGEVVATAEPVQVTYFDALQNGSFETPTAQSYGTYEPHVNSGADGIVWKTTASTGKIELVSVATDEYRGLAEKWHGVSTVPDGTQCAEINENAAGALYQDVLTTPGSTMYWQLYHAARLKNNGTITGTDTMYVLIMSTELAETYHVTTQSKVNEVISDIQSGGNKYPGASVKTITNSDGKWTQHNGTYIVPEDQYLTRYFFVAGSTASGDNTIGNHIDKIWFSTELPPPSPDKGHLSITKTVEGLDDAAIEAYSVTVTVTKDGATIGSHTFSANSFTKNENGTYTASYTMTNLDLGIYTVTETPSSVTGYTASAVVAVDDDAAQDGITASAAISANNTTTVAFRNTYVPQTCTVVVEKLVDGNMGDQDQFFTFSYTIGGKTETFTLKHGERKELTVDKGSSITISETDSVLDGYTTTVRINADEEVREDTQITLTPTEDTLITFTNVKNISAPTSTLR